MERLWSLPSGCFLAAPMAREIDEVKELSPNESFSLLKATHPIKNAQAMQRLVQDLRTAGLPEKRDSKEWGLFNRHQNT